MKVLKLGDQVEDTVTGFSGTLVAKTEWLNGCVRGCVQPRKLKEDGSPVEAEWIDSEQLVVIEERNAERKAATGGPMPDPAPRTGGSRR